MEVFDVKCGKDRAWARKSNGNYYITLPTRFGRGGTMYYDTISTDERGLRFTSMEDGNPDYYFHLWLQKDGRIAWVNDMQRRIQVCEVFTPEFPNAGVLNETASKVYEVAKQIEEYEKVEIPIPVDTILETRKHNLAAVLHMLGFNSIEDVVNGNINDSAGYLPLNRLSEELRQADYSSLPIYVHSVGRAGSHDLVRYNLPEGKTLEDLERVYRVVEKTKNDNFEYIKEQDDWIDRKRGISFDYNALLSARLGNDGADWEKYSKALQDTAMLFLGLNSDLLSREQRERLKLPNVAKLSAIEFDDMISALIDSRTFNEACKIENEFAFEESSRLARKAEGQLEGVTPEMEEYRPIKDMRALLENERAEIAKRKAYIDGEKTLYSSMGSRRKETKPKDKEDDDQYGY